MFAAYSKHLLEQIQVRGILIDTIEDVLNHPESITTEDGLAVYQKVVVEKDKPYLLRIFVNKIKQPPLVVTAYKTSKISKYYSL